ncbi:tim44-like domain protein [Ehrlichia chaffeensis str. Heartland]|uniref:Tim44-like domain protein n=1 Tax=Ehrlichia chaffeensis (strain ATCC CRL-10679 / Arkansas) TaxID=205920 RepID=Q2GHN0_EHRCR|nr:Tim44/TimA family putative adaptor protein [Ehrlichia chaffeensis]ABD45207.1 tim44-like domain protein [Ehrlichia chaffeensis str. Arkansas]AHX03363.1 tim44-like domain protein [Ehrlichia chaffeensis str. Heartland]AHX05918.1 tim44-like domain protein [Ehrlichia chaffeensis str. Jax]AHX06908.1 tim44-like domain protein [Ehrlichia chaffeensis str. Liberty]AHX07878.1 tim44-like domain protein [Ehrlichia chaffeensis str. Osceola]
MVELAIYAFLAAFIFFRLYHSLGKTSGLQSNSHSQTISIIMEDTQEHDTADIDIDSVMEICNENDKSIINHIKKKDKEFSLRHFMDGSIKAFEIIIKAFNEGNIHILSMLLDTNLYNSFVEEIENRKALGQLYEDIIVSITSHKITKLSLSGNIAYITVKFISEQINFVKDKDDNILQGSTSKINKIEDTWTFRKDTTLSNKKWYLSTIQSV